MLPVMSMYVYISICYLQLGLLGAWGTLATGSDALLVSQAAAWQDPELDPTPSQSKHMGVSKQGNHVNHQKGWVRVDSISWLLTPLQKFNFLGVAL